MPLKKGRSRKTVSRNIEEMINAWSSTGKIGTSRPATKKKASKQATAIALKKAGKSKYQSGAKRKPTAKKSTRKSSIRLVRNSRPSRASR